MSKEGGLLKCSCETKSVRNDIPIGLLWCYNSQNWLCVKELMKSKGQGNAQSCCLYENHFKFCYDWFYEIKQVFVKAGRTEGKIVLWVAGMSLDLSRRGENATWSEIKCNFELSIPCCWLVPGALLFIAISFTKITFPTSLPAVQNRKKKTGNLYWLRTCLLASARETLARICSAIGEIVPYEVGWRLVTK